MNEDFKDILGSLLAAEARFLVVGAYALAVHGVPRATGDLDIWIANDKANAERVFSAFVRFGAPVTASRVGPDALQQANQVIQIGSPPRRIDIMTSISGVAFDTAWEARVTYGVAGLCVPFLGRADLVRNKRAAGRKRDLADLEALGETAKP